MIAEQVVAALDGEIVRTAVNIPVVDARELEVLGPFVPLAAKLGRLAIALAGAWPARIDRRGPRPARRARRRGS